MRVLLGPAASGRTTLMRRISYETQAFGSTLALNGTYREPAALLTALLTAADLAGEDLDLSEMRRLANVYLHQRLASGRRVVIAIDDADGIGNAAWNEIERLNSLTSGPERRIELLLSMVHLDDESSAVTRFVRDADAPALHVLSWMNADDVGWYLHWRLERFGLAGVFTPTAIHLIAKCTQGCFAAV
ncbi:MAG: AAA family ATPase, partial [Gammaproteobacteria bacterium]|nr:AAA family ATPase [Gammaproteobacteria bacterium]